MVSAAVAGLIALGSLVLGAVGGFAGGHSVGKTKGEAEAAQAYADMAGAVGEHVSGAVEHALAVHLQQLENQGLVAAADRRVECQLGDDPGAVAIYACAIAVQQETCDESAVDANEQSACAVSVRTVDMMGRMLFCDAWSDAFHDEGSAAHEREVQSCLTRLGQ